MSRLRTVNVIEHQTVSDLSLQEYGTISALVSLAMANGLSITADLSPGQAIILPILEVDKDVLRHYKENNVKPATGYVAPELQEIVEDGEVVIDPDEGFFEFWEFTTEFLTDFN